MALVFFQFDNGFLNTSSATLLLHTQSLQTVFVSVCHGQQGRVEEADGLSA